MFDIKSKFYLIIILFFVYLCCNDSFYIDQNPKTSVELLNEPKNTKNEYNKIPQISSNGLEFSRYNLSVFFDEYTSSVKGNLSINYYNNDLVNFTRIPFHLFLSGMQYQSRMGFIEILNVTTLSEPKKALNFTIDEAAQLLWVNNLTIEPSQRAFFVIEFYSVIPDGGYDRANSHGSDSTQSRIYKFTSFYPMPCVYDIYDEWNTDPYLSKCDPFYHDMAYYDLEIEAPNGMVITATGDLIEEINKGTTTVYHFKPEFPVREVTFAASKWYIMQSTIINGVNISTYYLPKSSFLWDNDGLISAIKAFNLFNDKFGIYPYSSLNIVEEYASYGGMEYPAQVYISEGIDRLTDYYGNPLPTSYKKGYLEKVIVHEIAHQWWYNLVGFDEIDWGFLDEGLTCWSTDYYARHYYHDWTYFQSTAYYSRVRYYYATDHLPSKINQSAYDLIENDLDWVFISYYKSPLIFEKIYRTLGEDNFILGLKTFFEQYKFKIAMLSDLQIVLENVINASLDWFFFPWFDNDYLPKYRFSTCNFDDYEYILTIVIEDQNEAINTYAYSQQVTLRVYNSDGYIIHDEYVWINSTTSFNMSFGIIPAKVRLEYFSDVIVQLSLNSPAYIEVLVQLDMDLIPGYEISTILIICLFSLVYLATISLKKKGKISKI
ncbi:MAG: M1 family metallopeptidase [Promethearchaeota archaeon]